MLSVGTNEESEGRQKKNQQKLVEVINIEGKNSKSAFDPSIVYLLRFYVNFLNYNLIWITVCDCKQEMKEF